jgi:hypothetical protein
MNSAEPLASTRQRFETLALPHAVALSSSTSEATFKTVAARVAHMLASLDTNGFVSFGRHR